MKKIFTLVLISFLFFLGLKVEAGNATTTFTEGSFLNLYIRYKLETGPTHLAQYKAIYRGDTKEAYCLDPTSKLKTGYPYTLITSNIAKTLNIDPELWEEIELIMHYGYRYGNHTNEEWHAITQMLIWQKLHPNGTYEYTNGYNGSTIKNKFDTEKQEIENLVKEHLKRPSFNTKSYTLSVGEEIRITDKNAKIGEYNINNTPGISAKIEGNDIVVKALTSGDNTITISKSYPVSGEPTAIYTDSEGGQTLGVAGDLPSYSDTINIKVSSGKISVNIDRGEDYYSNCDNNTKTLYGLYDGTVLLETFDASEVNSYLSKELPYKDYYIKQISHACNDKEDKNIYRVSVNAGNPNPEVNITVEENYKELILVKKYGNKFLNSYYEEEEASFTIGDDHKTFSLKTDNNGRATVKLGYGTYTLKQLSGKEGYSLVANQTIVINDSTPDKYYFNLINEEIVGSIDVTIKRDKDYYSNCSNGNVTFYGLYEKDTNSLIRTFSGEDNTYHIDNLPLKKYYVKQLSNACNDKEDYNLYETEITKEKLNSKIKVTVWENYKEIVINKKYGNLYLNNYLAEQDASFKIGDDIKTFTITTDELGIARLKIGYGTYKLQQVKGIKNYELIEEQVLVVDANTLDNYVLDLINNEILGSVKVDIERGEDYYSNCDNNIKTVYGLYEKDSNKLIKTFEALEDGSFVVDKLPLKKYYVKQISHACNDKEDTKIYDVEIKEKDLNPEVKVKVEENYVEITINKKYGNYLDGKYTLERDALFTIGDENKIFDLLTNTKGNARIKLGYGKYTLKQITGKENYAFVDEKEIVIDSNTPVDYVIKLINEEILSNIKVVLKDEDGNLLSGIVVGLYKGNKKVKELVTNEKGEVYFTNLSLRDYTLKQLSIPEGYENIDNNETITLTEEDGLVIFINKKKVVIEEPRMDNLKNGEPKQEENIEEEIEVPDTYVNGDGKVIKISSMLLTIAFYLFVYGKKKNFNN